MKVHFEVEQGSLDWFLLKHGKVGGTRAKGLYLKTDTLFYDLLSEHTERYDEDNEDEGYTSDAMERGKYLEPQARLELNAYTGLEFLECGWIQSDIELLGISPDGITADLTAQCEIKCLGAKNHLRACLGGEIPLEYIPQCVHAFTVNSRLARLFFLAYRPESPKAMFVRELKRVSEVNIGTLARPVIKTVTECVELSKAEALRLETELKETINNLNF